MIKTEDNLITAIKDVNRTMLTLEKLIDILGADGLLMAIINSLDARGLEMLLDQVIRNTGLEEL